MRTLRRVQTDTTASSQVSAFFAIHRRSCEPEPDSETLREGRRNRSAALTQAQPFKERWNHG